MLPKYLINKLKKINFHKFHRNCYFIGAVFGIVKVHILFNLTAIFSEFYWVKFQKNPPFSKLFLHLPLLQIL
jgi:hypothetical protein